MFHKRMSLKTMVGKFKGGWGGVTSSTKSKICWDSLCHDVISTMTCNRLIRGFTCADMLPSQYYHFSQFSGIGVVGSWYVQAG